MVQVMLIEHGANKKSLKRLEKTYKLDEHQNLGRIRFLHIFFFQKINNGDKNN